MASILKVNTIQDATNSTTAISVDTAGRVTTPAKPTFLARKTSSDQQLFTSGGTNTKITFSQVDVNNGSHYDSTNSRFTAPVSGLYYFHVNLRLGTVGSTRVFTCGPRKNGSDIGYTRVFGVGGSLDFDSGAGSDHPYVSGSIILDLVANDYIEIFTGDEITFNTSLQIQSGIGSSHFIGYLLG